MKSEALAIDSQMGQATTAALILIPVVVLILSLLVILGFAFILEANATANCRSSLGESQSEASVALERLLALNPRAKKLEMRRNIAVASLKLALASGHAPAIAIARFDLMAAEKAQLPVISAQMKWISKGRRASLGAADRASAALQGSLPQKILQSESTRPELQRAKFQVVASPPNARTPVYKPAVDFERSQTAAVRWLLTLPETNKDGRLNPILNVGCAMTLSQKGDNTWSPQILEDKLLPN